MVSTLTETAFTEKKPWWMTWGRFPLTVGLPVITAVSTGLAALNKGETRAYIGLVAVAATFGTAYYAMKKDRRATDEAERATRLAVESAAALRKSEQELAMTIIKAGHPLMAILGGIATSANDFDRSSEIRTLVSKVISLANSVCGKAAGEECNTRSVLYLLSEDGRALTRYKYEGRTGHAPRPTFREERNGIEKTVVDLAKSETVLRVEDLDRTPHFTDSERSYKSFTAVPVRAGAVSYGLLAVDSDIAHTITAIDTEFLVLLAGSLAAAFAQSSDSIAVLLGHTNAKKVTTNVSLPRQGQQKGDQASANSNQS